MFNTMEYWPSNLFAIDHLKGIGYALESEETLTSSSFNTMEYWPSNLFAIDHLKGIGYALESEETLTSSSFNIIHTAVARLRISRGSDRSKINGSWLRFT
jgi:hypothetical protein